MNIDYLRVTVEHRGQVCELTVSGELDTCVADKFADAAMEAVGAAQGPVLVDLAGLEFMDVSGARSLAAVVRVITPRLAGLRSCRPPVRRVLELLGLDVDALSVDSARDFETRELIARSREISAYLASGVSNAGKVLDDLECGARLVRILSAGVAQPCSARLWQMWVTRTLACCMRAIDAHLLGNRAGGFPF